MSQVFGPVVSARLGRSLGVDPLPFNPNDPPAQVVSWAYAHWGREAKSLEGFLEMK